MKKIVITGPECSGKSQLTQQLAESYKCPWVAEYARFYLKHLPRPYVEKDLMAIAAGQESAMHDTKSRYPTAQWLFLDTWDVVLRIWHTYRFGAVPSYLELFRKRYAIDHYLLCTPDLPWVPDPMRENQYDRDELFEMYHAHLQDAGCSFSIISGSGDERYARAVQALDGL